MRVLFNTLTVEGLPAGIGHYASELVRCLRGEAGVDAVGTFPAAWLRGARACWARAGGPAAEGPPPGRASQWGQWRSAARQRLVRLVRRAGQALIRQSFRRTVRRGGYDLYHEPNFIPLQGDLPTVATVHDLSVLLHPRWHPASRVAKFEREFHHALGRCCHLMAISEFGKREIVEHLGWPPESVTVTYMGVRPGLQRVSGPALKASLRHLDLEEGYLLHVGTLEPRKNLLVLMQAYGALPAALRREHPLVLAGGPGWNSADVHAYLDREGRRRGVRWLGYVDERHFAALYSGARALVFPTRYEGFGMPTVEMMACGGAVIASTAAAVAEVAGRQAHLVDPVDVDGWRDAMLRVCNDDDWWRALRQGVEQAAAPFTWERCAAETLSAYQKALAGPQRTSRAA
jgi:alpha-1,3-rhamnosyl/mannosyltransferase